MLTRSILGHLPANGLRVRSPTRWEDYDARVLGSSRIAGEVVTSADPHGWVQLRVRRKPALFGVICLALLANIHAAALIGLPVVATVDIAMGVYRLGPFIRARSKGGAA